VGGRCPDTVAITLRFSVGDGLLAVLMIAAGLVYGLGASLRARTKLTFIASLCW